EPQAPRLPVVIGSGSHPFPFRTRKLSLLPPMVLHGKLCGRVGRCRHYSTGPIAQAVGPLFFGRRLSCEEARLVTDVHRESSCTLEASALPCSALVRVLKCVWRQSCA